MKKIEEDTNKGKGLPCLYIGRINVVKMSMLSNATSDSVQSLSRFQWHFFHRKRTVNLKICVDLQKTKIDKAILRKNEAGGITFPDFKLYCQL